MHSLAAQAYKAGREYLRAEPGFLAATAAAPASMATATANVLSVGKRVSRSSGLGLSVTGSSDATDSADGSSMTRTARKLSWVGVNEAKPYAYLREAMVSGLMGTICNPETVVERIDVRYDTQHTSFKAVSTFVFFFWCLGNDTLSNAV